MKYRVKKKFLLHNGTYVLADTELIQSGDDYIIGNGTVVMNGLSYPDFDKDFVETNAEFFEPVEEKIEEKKFIEKVEERIRSLPPFYESMSMLAKKINEIIDYLNAKEKRDE